MDEPRFDIKRYSLNPLSFDHPVSIFKLEIEDEDKGSWTEEFASESELEIFLKGFCAGWSMAGKGYLREPEIPRGPSGAIRLEDNPVAAEGAD